MTKADEPSVEDLRDNLVELRKDFKALLTTVERLAESQAQDVSNQVREGLKTYADKGEALYGSASKKAERVYGELHESVERNPMSAMMIALGLGYLIGVMTRSK